VVWRCSAPRARSADFKVERLDEQVGVDILRRALEAPIRQIATNAGVEGSIVVAKIRESDDKNYGFNAATEVYEDLVEAGVIDPTKVVRTALQNAASIAGLLLTTECVIVEHPRKRTMAVPGAVVAWAAWAACTEPSRRSRKPQDGVGGTGFPPRGGALRRSTPSGVDPPSRARH
jgi:hypothetical protein